ncbi:hypothetical protein [Deinococcus frigens]|uniref:hypothetical protein n=1 Tax=Deinococcus frigens TaxID=249403 RepID=UPI0004960302|nr:hypothetical protein [Deinococcus frigens]
MKIGYKVAYMMTGPTGLVTHNSERFTAQEFGSMRECREMAQWCADNLKGVDHISPVVIQELSERDHLEHDGQDSISVPLGRERGW